MGNSRRAMLATALVRLAATGFLIGAVALALGACADRASPVAPPAGDPITHGHSVWCGTNPPSGYCMYD